MPIQSVARRVADLVGRDSLVIRSLRPAYETGLHLIHGCRGVPWQINGQQYRIDPHERDRFGENYESDVADFLSQRIRPGSLCFDVGANVGMYVLQMARWSGPTGRVVAFEPNPAARVILRRHVSWNQIENQVSIEPTGVSSTAGKMTLFAHGADGMSRLNEANVLIASKVNSIEVSVVSLSDYCYKQGLSPDWVLIDIEGFEIQALLGFEQFLRGSAKPVGIVLEMHPDVWNSAGTTPALAQEVFQRLGRQPVALSGQINLWSEHGHVYCKPE